MWIWEHRNTAVQLEFSFKNNTPVKICDFQVFELKKVKNLKHSGAFVVIKNMYLINKYFGLEEGIP